MCDRFQQDLVRAESEIVTVSIQFHAAITKFQARMSIYGGTHTDRVMNWAEFGTGIGCHKLMPSSCQRLCHAFHTVPRMPSLIVLFKDVLVNNVS